MVLTTSLLSGSRPPPIRSGAAALAMAESGNLQTALLDQRMRADRHKTNFETLKAQHLLLQETEQKLKVELETLRESYDKLRSKSQDIIEALQSERDAKILECEELKAQALTGQKLDQLKSELAEETEEPYRKQLDSLECQLEALRSEYNKLRYNYTFLRNELDAATARHQTATEELKAKYERQIASYVEERKMLLARCERDIPTEVQRTRQLQRNNSQLQLRVRTLETENEELQAQRERAEALTEKRYHAQSSQLMEMEALKKTLEIERSSLAEQVQSLQGELSKARAEQHGLTDQLNTTLRELSSLKRKLDEAGHKHQAEISDLKMHHLHQCRELEQSRDACVSEQLGLQEQVEGLHKALQEHQTLLAEKERDLEQRVRAVREQEWENQATLQREKVELEERLAQMERVLSDSSKQSQQKLEDLEDQIRKIESMKSSVETELTLVNSQLAERAEQCQGFEAEIRQLSGVSNKYQVLLAEYKGLQQREQEVRNWCDKLEERVQLMEEHLTRAQDDLQRQQEAHSDSIEKERQSWSTEKEALTARLAGCQSEQQSMSDQLREAKKASRKQRKHHQRQVQELRNSLEVSKATEEKLALEKEALRKSMSMENQKLKRKFASVQHRQKEFLFLLHNDPFSTGKGGGYTEINASDQQYDQELQEVSERLEELATNATHHRSAQPSGQRPPEITSGSLSDSEQSAEF